VIPPKKAGHPAKKPSPDSTRHEPPLTVLRTLECANPRAQNVLPHIPQQLSSGISGEYSRHADATQPGFSSPERAPTARASICNEAAAIAVAKLSPGSRQAVCRTVTLLEKEKKRKKSESTRKPKEKGRDAHSRQTAGDLCAVSTWFTSQPLTCRTRRQTSKMGPTTRSRSRTSPPRGGLWARLCQRAGIDGRTLPAGRNDA
jgi:hypothetical protein